ncbi:Pyruvate carboxylase subunit A [Geodia barretti]|uniref:Pyruvate carboxylase subunit A n=1 Tax=Geodia barretti TaxID=519541 RepID=A0AA35RZ24_GEOBA|nr:Pyruvate carboxylase subunit A [Geodia barretti]
MLGGMDVSYYHGNPATALHGDICSPVATNPTWNDLDSNARATLEQDGGPLWHDLVKVLQPHIVTLSVARRHLRRIKFSPITDQADLHVFESTTERHLLMFSKVLVANRGEIAVRINQTLRALGIAPVAVHSDADAGAPHVTTAEQAVALPGNTAEETYLNIGTMVQAARDCGADAVHPGYGFLSENPQFARACREAQLTFIGPTAESMADLGDKLRSKEIARRAGVPVVPSSPVPPRAAVAAGCAWSNGRRELDADMEAAGREAQAAFGDGRVFLERYVANPRHVEVQVLADGAGHTIHLGERECSIQRRHQKIIEETPSPALTPDLRQRMGDAAIAVAREAGYVNAGTVEFLLAPRSGEFYFLEMNARLQVEHPVTEAVLGLDMVQWQVRIASGEPLTLQQEDIQPRGHAIECRIYAEDPYRDFVPSTGTLLRWRPPSGPGLRLDSGVVQGQEVSIYYDPMLAKLIAWAPDRELSRRRMDVALSQFLVLGVVTNIPLLRSVLGHPQFQRGQYDTGFLEWNPAVTRPAMTDESRMMARALGAWAAGQPVGSLAPVVGSDGPPNVSPWRSAGERRLP